MTTRGGLGFEHGIDARRGAAMMRAGLQRDVHRRAGGVVPLLLTVVQGFDLGMRPAALTVPALADDFFIAHEQRPDHRIGFDPAPAMGGQAQGFLHESLV